MQLKYTRPFLTRLEDIFAESEYMLRYEKGTFKSGFCLLKDTKVAVVNKYFPLEGKINCLVEILRAVEISPESLRPESQELFLAIKNQTLTTP
ncbi:hypothetical protein TH63_09875 [Rufibacter radiotolerans]|jgi:hypothetical protein|uniref:Uncharacterized protein n=1 Tax=Rufibacter radiotolerans TaxID=1379910 RepID=A0A0H4VJ82_9BACT|nr:hypothetical protein [Rufibacter radiotolerans]AKQ45880.1 hypothetical protein TH63_09875 [Rufibacter radiotolerans]